MDPPLAASIIGGTTALMVFHSPVRLISRVQPLPGRNLPQPTPIQHTGVGDDDVHTAELLQCIGHHALLSGGVADVDAVGKDLAAFALDQVHRLGKIFRLRRRIPVVLCDRPAGVYCDDVGPGAGQPDAV
jgi:hypothetical protein